MISLATSLVNEEVRANITSALDENRIGGGRFVKEFEDKVASYMGSKHAIAVCNGTMADIVAIAAMKALRPHKTEVIVPALTFTAQIAAVILNGLTPVFVDVNEDYQMDLNQAEEKINARTLGIMSVHLLGKECNIEWATKLAWGYGILLMEDCCEAYGGEYEIGEKFGTKSVFGTYSFFPSHTITTGEGGMIVTDNDYCAELARKIMNHGRASDKITEKFHFDMIGLNGKMSNLIAAIGCGVVNTADDVIVRRKANVELYNSKLGLGWNASSPHCYPLIMNSREERDEMLTHLESNGVESRKLFSSLPTQEKAYKYLDYTPGAFPVSESIGDKGLFLPVHQDLTEENITTICELVKK